MSEPQLEFLTGLISAEDLPGPHLEIGTAYGVTLAHMILARATESNPLFVVVDNMRYFDDQPAVVARTLTEHGIDPSRVEFRVGDSREKFREAEKAGDVFDFILIDASHRIRNATSDLRWTRLLRPGGLVCLHDYHPTFPGVMRSVDRFLGKHQNYRRLNQVQGMLALRKTAASTRTEITLADRTWATLWSLPLKWRR